MAEKKSGKSLISGRERLLAKKKREKERERKREAAIKRERARREKEMREEDEVEDTMTYRRSERRKQAASAGLTK